MIYPWSCLDIKIYATYKTNYEFVNKIFIYIDTMLLSVYSDTIMDNKLTFPSYHKKMYFKCIKVT